MASFQTRNSATSDQSARRDRILLACHEVLFALNLSYTFTYGFLFYIARDLGGGGVPSSDLGYYFRRGSIRLADLLHLHLIVTNSVSTAAVARQDPGRSVSIGADLLILISVLAVTLLILSVLRLTVSTSFHRVIFGPFALVLSLFGLPAIYLFVQKLTWPSGALHTFWQDVLLQICGGEILILILLAVISRKRILSSWTMGSLAFVHCALWIIVLWPEFAAFPFTRLLVPNVLIGVLPFSVASCLLYRRLRICWDHPGPRGETLRWVPLALLAVTVLMIVWRPPNAHPVDHPGSLESLQIEMSRGPCFGSCPAYTLTIQGSGKVEYVAQHFNGLKYPHQAELKPDQVRQIVEALDRAQFSTVEDRAFLWCYDTPSVSVTVSINGKTKRVVSDSYCDGMKFGVQDRFVQAAIQIDTIVGTSRWIER